MNIDELFNGFIEFPTENKGIITSVSAKLFAKHCVDLVSRDRDELLAQNERLRSVIIDATNNGAQLDNGHWVYSIDDSVLAETPAQSLEAVRLEWQIERDAESLRAQEEILARVQAGSDMLNNKDKTPIERIAAFSKVIGMEDLESIDTDNGKTK